MQSIGATVMTPFGANPAWTKPSDGGDIALHAALAMRGRALSLLEPVFLRASALTGDAESPGGTHGMLDAYPAAVSEFVRAFGGGTGR